MTERKQDGPFLEGRRGAQWKDERFFETVTHKTISTYSVWLSKAQSKGEARTPPLHGDILPHCFAWRYVKGDVLLH